MGNKNSIAALIVAAGKGERFGAMLPKQYQPLLGRAVLRWSIDTLCAHPDIDNVYVVIHPDHTEMYREAAEGAPLTHPIIGGETRQESVRLGLEAISNRGGADFVLIHDAARPGLSPQLVTRICAALETSNAIVPALPVTDTVRRDTRGQTMTENREGLYTIQTPQAFHFGTILGLHRRYRDRTLTDDAALCEIDGLAVKFVDGDKGNFKVTHEDDLAAMEQKIMTRLGDMRTGKGYDVHRLIPPRHDLDRLKIGGIEIPHDKVLEGHSDADVGLHAVTDALLGTICDGDIGMHFSPKDARWKNADSTQFLRHAAMLVAQQGGVISHVDLTIICEAPKIGPHRDKMRARISEILQLPVSRVSVKATTTEGLGFTGRGEGIVAEAMATVRLPFDTRAASSGEEQILKWGT